METKRFVIDGSQVVRKVIDYLDMELGDLSYDLALVMECVFVVIDRAMSEPGKWRDGTAEERYGLTTMALVDAGIIADATEQVTVNDFVLADLIFDVVYDDVHHILHDFRMNHYQSELELTEVSTRVRTLRNRKTTALITLTLLIHDLYTPPQYEDGSKRYSNHG